VSARLPLTALVVANATSLVGNVVASVAIPWFVLETTGSAARAGVAAFFTTLPLALGAVFGGAVADRVGARLASIVGDVAGGAAIAAIPALHALGALEFWHLLALAFLASLFDAPAQASREALLQDAAEHARMPL
jgi:MFS family permease